MEPAIFSASSLFQDEDEDEAQDNKEESPAFVERAHSFPGMDLAIREFSFHHLNANLLWPGSFAFGEWLVQNQSLLEGQRILELGSGTGALAIFLKKSFRVDITTSDFDDKEVDENIAYNCRINGLAVLPHIRHTWGEAFPTTEPDWDLIIASDILLYVKQYPKLIKTLCFLLNSYKPKDNSQLNKTVTISGKQIQVQKPFFLMSWRRRIGRDEELFFSGCENVGLVANHIGSRVYYISHRRVESSFEKNATCSS